MWMVRAGEGGYFIDKFRQKHIVAIDWKILGDLSAIKTYDKIRRLVQERFPKAKNAQITTFASQIRRFVLDINKGDKVVSYDPDKRTYLVGEVRSDYYYAPADCAFPHLRDVQWLGEVERDTLCASTKSTLGTISSVFSIGAEAEQDVLALLRGEKAPLRNEEEVDTLKEDILSKAREFMKDKILALEWEEMQTLIAGLLHAMGYKTIVSSRGADRGRDIQASPDGLGLEEPRIKVEVKHRTGQMGAQEVRSFTGGLRPGDKGLYVSTGGFSKDAKYEADRSNIPLTLIDTDMLVQLVVQYYDNFDSDTRLMLPLTKIYWPS